MPLYDYQCQACGQHCELLEKMSAAHATDCPSCHKPDLKRQVSAPQFQLKGSGWYVTDFKPGGQKTSSEAPKENTSKSPASPSIDTKSSSTPTTKD